MAPLFNKRIKLNGTASSRPAADASVTNLIVRFYDHNVQAKDSRGRTLEDILSWSDAKLESCHNYIQLLFPLPEGSPFNFEAPVIDREVFDAFRSRGELRSRLRRSYERMVEFYGFAVNCKVRGDGKQGQDEDKKESKAGITSDTDNDDVASSSRCPSSHADNKDYTITNLPSGPSDSTSVSYSIIRGPKWRNNAKRWCVRFDHNHLRITRILRCLRVLGLQRECEAFYQALQDVFDDPATSIGNKSMMYWTRAVQRPLHIAPDDDECEWLERWEIDGKGKETIDGSQHSSA